MGCGCVASTDRCRPAQRREEPLDVADRGTTATSVRREVHVRLEREQHGVSVEDETKHRLILGVRVPERVLAAVRLLGATLESVIVLVALVDKTSTRTEQLVGDTDQPQLCVTLGHQSELRRQHLDGSVDDVARQHHTNDATVTGATTRPSCTKQPGQLGARIGGGVRDTPAHLHRTNENVHVEHDVLIGGGHGVSLLTGARRTRLANDRHRSRQRTPFNPARTGTPNKHPAQTDVAPPHPKQGASVTFTSDPSASAAQPVTVEAMSDNHDTCDLTRDESYDSAWLLIEAFGSTWDVDLGDVDFDAPITHPLDG